MKKSIPIAAVIVVIIAVGASLSLIINPNNSSDTASELESYISCGCGCCNFDNSLEEIAEVRCLYKSRGENIQEKINQDNELSPEFCATAGCSFPIKYTYCD